MNKKILFIFIGLLTISTTALSAKALGVELDVGGVYTRHSQHSIGSCCDGAGFSSYSKASKNLGGLSLGINYQLTKNWALFANTMFTFHRTFVNDTQLGVGYTFLLGKGFNLFIGGGFALGGSISKYNENYTTKYFGIGGGFSVTASYMFTRQLGIYFGVSDSYYKPVTGKIETKNVITKLRADSLKNKIHQSLNARIGLRIKL